VVQGVIGGDEVMCILNRFRGLNLGFGSIIRFMGFKN
jgi:hypothetical protein